MASLEDRARSAIGQKDAEATARAARDAQINEEFAARNRSALQEFIDMAKARAVDPFTLHRLRLRAETTKKGVAYHLVAEPVAPVWTLYWGKADKNADVVATWPIAVAEDLQSFSFMVGVESTTGRNVWAVACECAFKSRYMEPKYIPELRAESSRPTASFVIDLAYGPMRIWMNTESLKAEGRDWAGAYADEAAIRMLNGSYRHAWADRT